MASATYFTKVAVNLATTDNVVIEKIVHQANRISITFRIGDFWFDVTVRPYMIIETSEAGDKMSIVRTGDPKVDADAIIAFANQCVFA